MVLTFIIATYAGRVSSQRSTSLLSLASLLLRMLSYHAHLKVCIRCFGVQF